MRFTQLNESIQKMNPEEPMNPEVLVQGYGVLTLQGLERMVANDIANLHKMAEQGNWSNVSYALDKSPLKAKLDAIKMAYEELETIRKRGGNNSRGIEKR